MDRLGNILETVVLVRLWQTNSANYTLEPEGIELQTTAKLHKRVFVGCNIVCNVRENKRQYM